MKRVLGSLASCSLALAIVIGIAGCGSPPQGASPGDTDAVTTAGADQLWTWGGVPPTPEAPRAFWYGGDVPPSVTLSVNGQPTTLPIASLIQTYLTKPLGQMPAPLTLLSAWMMTYDNKHGQSGLTKAAVPGKTWPGYTLLSALGGYHGDDGKVYYSILIDMDGNIVNKWPLFGFPAKMLPGGDVMGGGPGGLENHQEQGSLIQMDWCGNPVWSWSGPPNTPGGARQHHDYEREGNPVGYYAPHAEPAVDHGKTLVLSHENPDQSLTAAVSDKFPLEEDVIYEVDWSGQVLWTWHPYEHIDQMGFDKVAREAIRTNPVGAPADIGGGFPGTDWQHINAASYVGPNRWHEMGDLRFHPDNIIWDGRSTSQIAIVARHDHPRGKWKAGDIVWRIGPDFGPGHPEHDIGQIIGQHHAHIIPRGLPGAGNLLVFDNGGLSGFGALLPGLPPYWPVFYRTNSRVLEIDPITLKIVWQYVNRDDTVDARQFFSWYISSAQRLPNGNTLVTEGANGRLFEVTRAGEIVWEYIWPSAGPGFGNAVYRAYRVPPKWVPIDKQCPTIAG